jgi:bacteriorhodopsin
VNNVPNWLWFVVAVILILVLLWLVGIRVHVG